MTNQNIEYNINERTIYDVDEEQIAFVSNYLVDICKAIDPTITEENVKGRITAIQLPNEKYEYFFDKKVPILTVDLKLLMDGT